jgi:uncharacterized protein
MIHTTELPGTQAGAAAARAKAPPVTPMMGVASPVALGLSGFGLTFVVFSAVNAGWLDGRVMIGVLPLAIIFGGGAQFVAGLWAFLRGEAFLATTFCGYGSFWLSFWVLQSFFAPAISAQAGTGAAEAFLGLFMFMWAVFTAYVFLAALAHTRGIQLVLALLIPTFGCLAIGHWASSATGWITVGGWFGVACGAVAMYVAGAELVNSSFGRRVFVA